MQLRFTLFIFLVTLSSTSAQNQPQDPKPKNKVLILSIDGFRPDFYLNPKTQAPNIQKFAQKNIASAGMITVFPSNTYPSHASLVTGVGPAVHGIHGNMVFDSKEGITEDWHWNESWFKHPPLWKSAKKAGRSVAILRWPSSVGADVDYLLPEVFGRGEIDVPRDWEIAKKHFSPGFLDMLWKESRLKSKPGITRFEEYDELTTDAVKLLVSKQKPDLIFAHYVLMDWVQHENGRSGPVVTQALKKTDALLGEVFSTPALKEYSVFVVGDHGFMDTTESISVNSLFLNKNWIKLKDGKIQEWKVLAQPQGGTAVIYIKDKKIKPQVLELLRRNSTGNYRVVSKEFLDDSETLPLADFALEAYPGKAFSRTISTDWIKKSPKPFGNHGYDPRRTEMETGFIASIPGLPKKAMGEVSILDVAPTVCEIMHLQCPAMTGKKIRLEPNQ